MSNFLSKIFRSITGQATDDKDSQIASLIERLEVVSQENERLVQENSKLAADIKVLVQEKEQLLEQNKLLESTVKELQEIIKELRRQLGQNSSNSSKPPSSDGFKKPKPKSRRQKTGKKRGGQPGHKGSHMKIPHKPDEVLQRFPDRCQTCPNLCACQANGNFICVESRYTVDVVVTTKVTEYQSLQATRCPCGASNLRGSFPEDVRAYVQYGKSVAVLATLLNTYGAVSLDRIHIILGSLIGVSLSPATILSMVSKCREKIDPILQEIKQLLIKNDVNHYDETGIRVNGKVYWVHNASSTNFTYQTVHQKRGREGIDDNGVLANASGVAVHDFWSPYFKYDNVDHAMCAAHIFREADGVTENNPDHVWAIQFVLLLLRMVAQKERDIAHNKTEASQYHLHKFSQEYDRILDIAEKECPPPEVTKKKRGRPKKGKERSLIERLLKFKEEVTRFFWDYAVPLTNNPAEQDIRISKIKANVSGSFRTEQGAKDFCGIISYLSTGRKNGITAFEAITAAFSGLAKIVIEKFRE